MFRIFRFELYLNCSKRLESRCSPLVLCKFTTTHRNQCKKNERYAAKKRNFPFSNVHINIASDIIGVDIDYLLQNQQLGTENIIQLLEPPNELYIEVYERLNTILRTHSYPHGLSYESNETTYVDTLLYTIVDCVNKQLKTDPKILLVKEYDVKMIHKGDVLWGKIDYAVVQISSRRRQACLLIVECKEENVDVAVKQCLLALKYIYSDRYMDAAQRRRTGIS